MNVLTKQCPDGYVFNAGTKMCRPLTSAAMCGTVNCQKSLNKWVPFEMQRGYYAFCGRPKPTMFKCSDEDNLVFDPTVNKCIYNCQSSGYFVDRLDCRSYYICENRGRGYIAVQAKCNVNYYFDKVKLECVRGTCECEIKPDDDRLPGGGGGW